MRSASLRRLAEIPVATWLGRLLRLPLRWIPEGSVVRILQGPLRGKRWVVGAFDHGCWLGTFEPDKQKLFAEALRPGAVVYDVGAAVGFYTLLAADRVGEAPGGQVIAFEPLPRNLKLLRQHIELNHVENVRVFEAAVGERSGTAQFEAGATAGIGKLGSAGGLEVSVVGLDELVQQEKLPPPDFIKMDIEGGEVDALRGARSLLTQHRPVVFLATHGREIHRDCCALLRELGYELTPVDARPLDGTDEILARPSVPEHLGS